jgi:predicted HD phosphohydrolase
MGGATGSKLNQKWINDCVRLHVGRRFLCRFVLRCFSHSLSDIFWRRFDTKNGSPISSFRDEDKFQRGRFLTTSLHPGR